MTDGIRITRLYPNELDLPGDRGNIEALQLRARRADLDVDFRTHAIGDGPIEPTDLLVLGTGPASVIDRVLTDARAHRDEIAEIIASQTPVLAIGTGAEILSQSITTLDGVSRDALGLLPLAAVRNRDRRIGYVIAESPVGELIGFEDHASRWTAQGDLGAFGTIRIGRGIIAFGERWAVGVRTGNVFAMQLGGPLLPLNPAMTDLLLSLAAAHATTTYALPAGRTPADDYVEGVRERFEGYAKGKELHYIRV